MAELKDLFKEAEGFRKIGRFDAAIEIYNRILEIDSNYDSIYSILGEIYYIMGDVENAVRNYELEIAKDDSNCLTMYRLGIAYYRATKFNRSIQVLKSLVDKGCQLDMAYYWIGLSYFHTGRIEKSIEMLTKLREKMPQNTVGCYHLALAHQTLGDNEKAIECLEKIRDEDDDIVSVHYHLAIAYLEKMHVKKAIKHLERVLKLDENHKPAQKMLDEIFNDQEMLYSYGVKLTAGSESDEELNINYRIGEAYKGFNKINETFKYLKEIALKKEQ